MTLPSLTVAQQGVGVASADDLNTKVMWAANVAGLRAFTGLGGMTVWMQGTTAPNDGGQGTFFYDPGATALDDGGVTTIQPSGVTGAGRWIRQPLSVGAIADGSLTLAKLAPISTLTLLGNNTNATGPVEALTVAEVNVMLGSIPTGAIVMFGGQNAPSGWYVCDGSAVSRTTDASLFAAIGTSFGPGNGATTFNLPDFLGTFARGWDSGGTRDPARTFGSTQSSALETHQHISDTPSVFISTGYTGPFGNTTVTNTQIGFDVAGSGTRTLGLTNDGSPYSGFNPNSGGQVTTETRPTNVAVLFIIKR